MPGEIAAWFNTFGFTGSSATLNGHIKNDRECWHAFRQNGPHLKTGLTLLHAWTTLMDNLMTDTAPPTRFPTGVSHGLPGLHLHNSKPPDAAFRPCPVYFDILFETHKV
jgi:hypothetical protein